MSDTKTPGEKKLTLSLKPRTETGEEARVLVARVVNIARETGMYTDVHEDFGRASNDADWPRSCLVYRRGQPERHHSSPP